MGSKLYRHVFVMGSDYAQLIAASDVGNSFLLGPNMEISLDGYFDTNYKSPGGWCRPRLGATKRSV